MHGAAPSGVRVAKRPHDETNPAGVASCGGMSWIGMCREHEDPVGERGAQACDHAAGSS